MSTGGPRDNHLLLALVERSSADGEADGTDTAFLGWLASGAATPEDRHRAVLGLNLDVTEPDVIEWIVRQPDCDRATALAAFWRTGPGVHLLHPDLFAAEEDGNEYAAVQAGIRARWRAGFYARAELAFPFGTDPLSDDFVTDADFGALERRFGPDLVGEVFPPDMRVSLPGRRLTPDGTIDGIPYRFWPREWFDAEGEPLPAEPFDSVVANARFPVEQGGEAGEGDDRPGAALPSGT